MHNEGGMCCACTWMFVDPSYPFVYWAGPTSLVLS